VENINFFSTCKDNTFWHLFNFPLFPSILAFPDAFVFEADFCQGFSAPGIFRIIVKRCGTDVEYFRIIRQAFKIVG